jgi:hypothetical protein
VLRIIKMNPMRLDYDPRPVRYWVAFKAQVWDFGHGQLCRPNIASSSLVLRYQLADDEHSIKLARRIEGPGIGRRCTCKYIEIARHGKRAL